MGNEDVTDAPVTAYTTGTGKTITLQQEPECQPHATIEDWLDYGIRMGWVSEGFCGTHDVFPGTPEEEAEFEEHGEPPCNWLVRVWTDGHPTHVEGGREGW